MTSHHAIPSLSVRTGVPVRALAALGLLAALGGCVGVAAPVAPNGLGSTCYAGAYVCQLAQDVPLGSQCTCPGLGAPSYGDVR